MANMLRRWRGQNQRECEPVDHDKMIKDLRTAIGPLSGRAKKFCTDACLRRYLEARNWNLEKAKKMLEETLEWRSTYKPEEIRWDEVAHEGETGKVSRANFVDRSGRPVLIMRPGKQNTKTGDGNVRHLVYLIENAILNLPKGQEQMTWLIDFTGFSMSASNIQMKTSRDIVNVLQNHYPERLAIIVLYNPPKIFQPFFKVLSYFIDPKTYLKIKFVYPSDKASIEVIKSYFDTENLPSEFGGNANFNLKYDHEEFSKLMAEDDIKTARFWDSESERVEETNANAHCVTPLEPETL
ncbi:putative CRAL-TRIO lipid binding domain, CRAL/TRIO domain, CRAL/TRIO domain superfamily [Helianthus annuus]|uniref:CRAL-TRIO lipid binding domain, CRAL/TRIO domain, CRAL/TRIO domain superfamily n=2 Tax=Helianthus annuus TaxID=4232 RepID=A0A9K3DXW8_HELAN|nr:phosphatidylinositol transfer protein 3 [Helianthus annuus]XP_022015635.1 phosphatidylinositol transfer protein 3 [Helianthus annuus]XP_022015636.1 phosphatidylinositol transfer protein 3 [Helianthus annuus]KAF5762321.1 putative CRAL-TRIO lipid binding domain, CRAL/TRIO domain, CRAL/TRIO domain superfamily [Helianthus annuus]KAJ0646704.1 putative CRAL-TRIO lipid binding domain, CRAL/TRIO domain, CRAL/TRIO domain superfamily [Helianthus annuus]